MQNDRFSVEKNRISQQETSSSYARGYEAGFEAGRRTSHIDSVQQHQRPINAQVFRFSEGAVAPVGRVFVNARANQIKKSTLPMNREGVTHIDEQQLKNIDRHHHEEHEINGQISSPNTPVQFDRHGHY